MGHEPNFKFQTARKKLGSTTQSEDGKKKKKYQFYSFALREYEY
jgi:hypothetical protein